VWGSESGGREEGEVEASGTDGGGRGDADTCDGADCMVGAPVSPAHTHKDSCKAVHTDTQNSRLSFLLPVPVQLAAHTIPLEKYNRHCKSEETREGAQRVREARKKDREGRAGESSRRATTTAVDERVKKEEKKKLEARCGARGKKTPSHSFDIDKSTHPYTGRELKECLCAAETLLHVSREANRRKRGDPAEERLQAMTCGTVLSSCFSFRCVHKPLLMLCC
jgi:hypothetical protein